MAGWLMAAVLAGACRRTTEEEVSTQLASTPVTSEALRSWAESQSYVVRTEGISRGSGGGPCGHSPLCILVPVGQVLGAIFSERSELITVLDGETVMAQGAFKESGGLLHMRTRQDDHWREFQRLPLSTIHREPIVETASIDINADGSDGERTPLPILPQLAPENPLDDYDAYLERFSPNDDRSYWMQALIEALRYFPNEADSWVTAHIRGASRDRQAALLSRVCNSAPDTPEQHALESFAFDAYEALMFDGARVRPEITFNLHNCRTQRQRVLGRYARALCDGDEVLARRNPIHDDDVELEGCPQRRPLLALWFGREPSPARLREAFESDPFADAFYQHLRWERPLDRALLFERIDRAPFERRHLYPLLYGGVHPNDAELATLWRAMNRTSPLERIGTSLAWLISRADAPRRAALLATVAESPERCALASRALLGDTQSARHALNGLSEDAIDWDSVRAPTPGRHSRAYITGVQTCETLAAWALARRGCGVDELRTMLRNPSTTLTCFIP